MTNNVEKVKIISTATDPIYIGTGGYTIGRVDNTIVRDPITKIPKIPGSSLAGVWRYYVTLTLQSFFKEEFRLNRSKRAGQPLNQLFNDPKVWGINFEGNRYAAIKCAGQDELPGKTLEEMQTIENTGHCGHCLVCKAFGYSKKDQSSQGILFFSDLNILFFPVYTRLGVKWITSERILKESGYQDISNEESQYLVIDEDSSASPEGYLNLGWLNLPYKKENLKIKLPNSAGLELNDIIIVPDHLISQIINSNLEVRTSVSIDPITGAAKEGALFTSEAIPRATVFYGTVRVIDRAGLKENSDIPSSDCVKEALKDSKCYFETLGIGGMTTRGFGRMRICLPEAETTQCESQQNGGSDE